MRDPAAFAGSWRPVSPRFDLVQEGGPPPPSPSSMLDTRWPGCSPRARSTWFWPFARQEPHGHPPFYAIVGLVGDVLAPSWTPLARARLGPMLVFGLTAGALFAFLARQRGGAGAGFARPPRGPGPSSPGSSRTGITRTHDALLSSLWVGAILAFVGAVEADGRPSANPRWGRVVAFGMLAGAAAATKLTGWFLPVPFVAWAVLARDRRAARALPVAAAVAALTAYALIPPWWGDPIGGFRAFLVSNLTRGRTTYIPTLFLGRVYLTPQGSLPWYNTLAWTAFVTPVGFLALSLLGAGWAVGNARSRPIWSLVVVHWAALLVLRGFLPHTPGHDAERQFLAAFGCLAICAGLGAGRLVERRGRWGKVVVVAALLEGAASVAAMMPVPLSYYSPIVGGLPGAARLGMEPTYYWDALGDGALDAINRRTAPGEIVLFPVTTGSLRYLAASGKLRPDFLDVASAERVAVSPAWYIVQNRPGALTPQDRALVARAGPEHVLVSKWGGPLIWALPRLGPAARGPDVRSSPGRPILAEPRLGPGRVVAGQGRVGGLRVVDGAPAIRAAVIRPVEDVLQVERDVRDLGPERDTHAGQRLAEPGGIHAIPQARRPPPPARADEHDVTGPRAALVDVQGQPVVGQDAAAVAEQVDLDEARLALDHLAALVPSRRRRGRGPRPLVRQAEDLDPRDQAMAGGGVADLDGMASDRLVEELEDSGDSDTPLRAGASRDRDPARQPLARAADDRDVGHDPPPGPRLGVGGPDRAPRVDLRVIGMRQGRVEQPAETHGERVAEVRPDPRRLEIRVHAGEGRGHRPGLLGREAVPF